MHTIPAIQKDDKRGTCRRGRTRRYLTAVVVFLLAGAVVAVCLEAPLLRAVSGFLPPLDAVPFLEAHLSPMLLDRHEALICAYLNEDEQWLFPVDLDAISPWLVQATLAAEDKRFFSHAGIDLRAVLRAAWRNMRAGHIVSGASTLTMQLAKRRQTAEGRLAGKLEQAFTALRLEQAADKRSILAAYLNTAPYGGNLVGVEAAARRYFGKSCTEITLEEAALLAEEQKSPRPNPFISGAGTGAPRRRARMRHEGMISEKELWGVGAALGRLSDEYPVLAPPHSMSHRAAGCGTPGADT